MGSDRSRRDLLAGIAAVGGTGALVGTGTATVLSDEERLVDSLFVSGGIDLAVEWRVGDETGSSEGEASFAIEFSGPDADRTGTATFTVSLPDDEPNNPAYGWLRAACPGPTDLAASLDVTLRYAQCDDGGGELASGSLLEVANELRNGVVLSPACDPGATAGSQGCLRLGEPVALALDWALDEDYVGSESTSFALEFVGRQCRHQDGTTNPFTPVPECEEPTEYHGVSFVEVYACDGDGEPCDCRRVGKLELEDDYCGQEGIRENYVAPGRRYDLYPDVDACDRDTGYDVRVTDTTEKREDGTVETTGVAFELLDDGAETGPDLCRVDVKGGSGLVTYDDPDDFEGNATSGVLSAPERNGEHT